MEEVYICELCQRAYEPEDLHGVRKLKTFRDFTVDLRLRQFRKVTFGELPQFIWFNSPEGQRLLAQMHEQATQ